MDTKILISQILSGSDSTVVINGPQELTVLELLLKGGFMMLPLLVLFFITIYILIEKILVINKESKSPRNFNEEILSRIKNDDINGAKLICEDVNTRSL